MADRSIDGMIDGPAETALERVSPVEVHPPVSHPDGASATPRAVRPAVRAAT